MASGIFEKEIIVREVGDGDSDLVGKIGGVLTLHSTMGAQMVTIAFKTEEGTVLSKWKFSLSNPELIVHTVDCYAQVGYMDNRQIFYLALNLTKNP